VKNAGRISIALAILISFATCVYAKESSSASGRWAGATKARCGTFTTDHSRCNAVQNITLDLVQNADKVSGTYTCAYGNQNCRGMQEEGSISQGSIKGNQLALTTMTPERSTCRFSGIIENNAGKGTYYCKGGSQRDERGTWRIKREQ
jgi:hypothetical protein